MTQDLTKWATWREIQSQPDIWRIWGNTLDVAGLRAWIGKQNFDEVWFCGAGTSAYIGDIIAASVKGTDPKNVETTGSASASVTPETKANTVEVTKTASTLNIATPKVGDIVTFEIKVENKGNQTLDNVTLTDALTDDQLECQCQLVFVGGVVEFLHRVFVGNTAGVGEIVEDIKGDNPLVVGLRGDVDTDHVGGDGIGVESRGHGWDEVLVVVEQGHVVGR